MALANSGSKWVSAAFLEEVANDMSFHGPDSCLPIRHLFGETIGDGIRTGIFCEIPSPHDSFCGNIS